MILCALLASAVDAGPRVTREVASPDGRYTLQWLAGSDGSCAGMRLLDGKSALRDQTRYLHECSRITVPFSPDGQHALFMADAVGPIHVVPVRTLAGYLQGELMADRVVYPSENPGMPPSPERLVEFLGWRNADVFELSGTSGGGASRYSFVLSQGRIVETCHKDALRPRCLFASPDGGHAVLLTSGGFHLVKKSALEGFLVGAEKSVFVPSSSWKGVVRPVFVAWQPGRILLQGEADDGQPHEFLLDVTTGDITRGKRVEWDWKKELP